MGREPGQYGGVVRMLIGGQKDIRLMTINGYARLIGFDEKLNFQPDILEAFERSRRPHLHVQDPRRPQMVGRQPLTSEDFRYMWEDVLFNEDLSPGGLSPVLLVGRQAAGVRGRRRAHGALHLGCAEPGFPAGARRGAAAQPGAAGRTT